MKSRSSDRQFGVHFRWSIFDFEELGVRCPEAEEKVVRIAFFSFRSLHKFWISRCSSGGVIGLLPLYSSVGWTGPILKVYRLRVYRAVLSHQIQSLAHRDNPTGASGGCCFFGCWAVLVFVESRLSWSDCCFKPSFYTPELPTAIPFPFFPSYVQRVALLCKGRLQQPEYSLSPSTLRGNFAVGIDLFFSMYLDVLCTLNS